MWSARDGALRGVWRGRWELVGGGALLVLVALFLIPYLTARPTGSADGAAGGVNRSDFVQLPTEAPRYEFPPGMEQRYPDAAGFLRQFLETCLAGDYAAYRRLVARRADPETRTRFERMLQSLRSLTVESIRTVELPDVAGPVYVVTSRVEFAAPAKGAQRREGTRRVAILVLNEDGEWRMALAPAHLQPPGEETPAETAPATTTPSYPWQGDGDY